MSFSAKRWAYSDMPSRLSQSAISSIAAHPPAPCVLPGEDIRVRGPGPFLPEAICGLEWPTVPLASPPAAFLQHKRPSQEPRPRLAPAASAEWQAVTVTHRFSVTGGGTWQRHRSGILKRDGGDRTRLGDPQ